MTADKRVTHMVSKGFGTTAVYILTGIGRDLRLSVYCVHRQPS